MKQELSITTVFLIVALLLFHFVFHSTYVGEWRTLSTMAIDAGERRILLVPLDSRPPCQEFVVSGGRIVGWNVITPPTEYMDYYSMAGDTHALRDWLAHEAGGTDAVILSVDQLLSGGLLAAREAHIAPSDIAELANDLRALHAAHPSIPLHAFYILPRAIPQDGLEGWRERRALLAYARLLGRAGEGLPVDAEEMERLRAQFPPDYLEKYLAHFEESTALAAMLIGLTEEGVLTRLVLGQDDGEEYSVGNLKKAELAAMLAQKNIAPERAMIVHGADEIALSMLTRIALDELRADGGAAPRISLRYAGAGMDDAVFPFMAVSNDATAREKIAMLGASLVEDGEDRDLTLFISAGDSNADTLGTRAPAAAAIRDMMARGMPVALVDLSRHFHAEETLLPMLIEKNVPVNALTAYAGWNTASNAIGTALSEALLYHCAMQCTGSDEEREAYTYANLAFLTGRIAEDEFYLKETIDRVNNTLRIAGYRNTADLDLTKNWRWANDLLTHDLDRRIRSYESSAAFRAPFQQGDMQLGLVRSNITAYYPWPRTFEVRLEAAPTVEISP
ncbi:PF13552 family protein [Selenomonas sp. FOBRC6]|uniref:DUF4127 family protein n=1 Tax=Selenomonas sp. FOBRC6 TaxID=936572 RepID=UPI000278282C|nr:DUF4127 family protein [Selenomonas sp. FOBRC6]EJO23642.1 PF13552 family protein [Selenomonas sp. FOBRC6]